jgi:hypothetical protein
VANEITAHVYVSEGQPGGKGRAGEQHDAYGEIVGAWRRPGVRATSATILRIAPTMRGRESVPENIPGMPMPVRPTPPAHRRAVRCTLCRVLHEEPDCRPVLERMPLDDLEALTWLRSQPEGRVAVNAAKLGRQWGWNRMRTSRRLKAWARAGLIRRNAEAITVTGSATPTVTEDTAATA